MSLGSGCHLERDETESGTREPDRESASNTAIAGTSLTGYVRFDVVFDIFEIMLEIIQFFVSVLKLN